MIHHNQDKNKTISQACSKEKEIYSQNYPKYLTFNVEGVAVKMYVIVKFWFRTLPKEQLFIFCCTYFVVLFYYRQQSHPSYSLSVLFKSRWHLLFFHLWFCDAHWLRGFHAKLCVKKNRILEIKERSCTLIFRCYIWFVKKTWWLYHLTTKIGDTLKNKTF